MNTLKSNPESSLFGLGRHGESEGNVGNLSQGRGEDKPGKPNKLTPKGVQQVKAAVLALNAAGFEVTHLSSSDLARTKESAQIFIESSEEPKPINRGVVAQGEENGLKEVSQKGWEGVFDRETTKTKRAEKLNHLMGRMALAKILSAEVIKDYAGWVMRFGEDGENEGESPIAAALRGISEIERHDPKPGEVIFSHAMLNRYIDPVAIKVSKVDRDRLRSLLEDDQVSENVRQSLVIAALKELGFKPFKTHDSSVNRQANAGVTEYERLSSGLWIPGRRIEPPKLGSRYAYIEHRRNNETDLWERMTPGEESANNE